MNPTDVVGVDPGLIHTGVVLLSSDPEDRLIAVDSTAVAGLNPLDAVDWLAGRTIDHIFIEDYRPRSAFDSDKRMLQGVRDFAKILDGKVLNNTGVKKVVRRPLLELLGCWSFRTVTHHQDLRSAAAIAVLGMLKDEAMNRLLFNVVVDHLDGRPWYVHS